MVTAVKNSWIDDTLVRGVVMKPIFDGKNVGGSKAVVKKAKNSVRIILFKIDSKVVKINTQTFGHGVTDKKKGIGGRSGNNWR